MDLRHLRYFAAVAKLGSIAGAASSLRVAQPPLSRQLRALELEVGVPLLIRERRGVRLTPAGAELLAGIRALEAELEQALQHSHLAHEGMLGSLRIGLGRAALESARVGRAIAAVTDRYPYIRLVLHEVPEVEHTSALSDRRIDLAVGLLGLGEEGAFRHAALYADDVDCAVLSTTHPLATCETIAPEQLKGMPLLVVGASITRGFHQLFEALVAVGLDEWEPHTSLESVYNLVAAGKGFTVALRSAIANPPAGTVVIPIEGFKVPFDVVVRWREADRSRVLANAIRVMRTTTATGDVDTQPLEIQQGSPRRIQQRQCVDADVSPGLELRQLRALLVSVEEGSISAAAERLGLTQSGMSRQVSTLEHAVGYPLLERFSHGITPTPAGQALHDAAARILALADDAIIRARRVENGNRGTCTIGAIPGAFVTGLLVSALRQIGEQHPDIALTTREIYTPGQCQALRDGEIDIGIAQSFPGLTEDPAIATVGLLEDTLEYALLAASHPLASRSWVTAAELSREPFLFIPRSFHPRYYDLVMQGLAQAGLTPRISDSYEGARTIWRLTADSRGWTIGTRRQRSVPPAGLVAVPIEGLRIPWGIQLLWRRGETDRAVRAVLDTFREPENFTTAASRFQRDRDANAVASD